MNGQQKALGNSTTWYQHIFLVTQIHESALQYVLQKFYLSYTLNIAMSIYLVSTNKTPKESALLYYNVLLIYYLWHSNPQIAMETYSAKVLVDEICGVHIAVAIHGFESGNLRYSSVE